jgi:peptidoglycan biosynthesis protein MviN/MurJ (putative lipid II flippase)
VTKNALEGFRAMFKRKQTSLVSAIGGLLQLLGGIMVIITQVSIFLFVLDFLALIVTIPPEFQPLYRTLADMILIAIVAVIFSAIVMIVSGIISYWDNPVLGGYLALFFSIPVIIVGVWLVYGVYFFPGIFHFLGAILGIIGGLICVIPTFLKRRELRKERTPRRKKRN